MVYCALSLRSRGIEHHGARQRQSQRLTAEALSLGGVPPAALIDGMGVRQRTRASVFNIFELRSVVVRLSVGALKK